MTLDDQVLSALRSDLTIDITTIGAQTGEPRRIEIWFYNVADRIYITGTPGARDWYANMLANPSFTFHLKRSVRADLPAIAVPVTDEESRRSILSVIMPAFGADIAGLDRWVAESPLVEVTFPEA